MLILFEKKRPEKNLSTSYAPIPHHLKNGMFTFITILKVMNFDRFSLHRRNKCLIIKDCCPLSSNLSLLIVNKYIFLYILHIQIIRNNNLILIIDLQAK